MSPLNRLRRPEYTGENRCMACTYVNVVLAICATALLIAVGWRLFGLLLALAVGVAFAGLAAASIWLRGYLVPGTPSLTKRYFPDAVLRRFGKAPEVGVGPSSGTATSNADGVGDHARDDEEPFDHETLLRSAGAIEPCEDVDDLCLNDAFGREWSAHLEDVPADLDAETAAERIGIDLDHDETHVQYYENGTVVTKYDRPIVEWPSDAAMRLDVAGARALADHSQHWDEFDGNQRASLVAGLRVFVEECPDGDPAVFSEEEVESCCTTHTVVTLDCADSGARLFEWRVD